VFLFCAWRGRGKAWGRPHLLTGGGGTPPPVGRPDDLRGTPFRGRAGRLPGGGPSSAVGFSRGPPAPPGWRFPPDGPAWARDPGQRSSGTGTTSPPGESEGMAPGLGRARFPGGASRPQVIFAELGPGGRRPASRRRHPPAPLTRVSGRGSDRHTSYATGRLPCFLGRFREKLRPCRARGIGVTSSAGREKTDLGFCQHLLPWSSPRSTTPAALARQAGGPSGRGSGGPLPRAVPPAFPGRPWRCPRHRGGAQTRAGQARTWPATARELVAGGAQTGGSGRGAGRGPPRPASPRRNRSPPFLGSACRWVGRPRVDTTSNLDAGLKRRQRRRPGGAPPRFRTSAPVLAGSGSGRVILERELGGRATTAPILRLPHARPRRG